MEDSGQSGQEGARTRPGHSDYGQFPVRGKQGQRSGWKAVVLLRHVRRKPDTEGAALPGKLWGRPEGRRRSRGLRQRAAVNWNCPPLI